MSAEDGRPGTATFARQRRFWTITRWAAVFGVVMAAVGILWLPVVDWPDRRKRRTTKALRPSVEARQRSR